ncbi:phenylalanyl-tRNA synthetase alpha subunit [Cenarchaeum symbiosum A]|uniref:phenylalanine--tRNA ligase n=1 Tax=Cenarchaeum symbiosum (strain A) TaxID=414004 RepID=A0RTQ7_CENSY|nr:phenylalanyl-tRNA synthetase alpha subunit [Cenarchaeum symbiosum A]
MQVLHEIEKKIIGVIRGEWRFEADLPFLTGLSPDQVRRGIQWLKHKDIITVNETANIEFRLGKNGLEALANKLPERRLMNALKGGQRNIRELKKELGGVLGPAMGIALREGWISNKNGIISLEKNVDKLPGEDTIERIGEGNAFILNLISKDLDTLRSRPNFIIEKKHMVHAIELKDKEIKVDFKTKAIDVEADAPVTHPARVHPLNEVIAEIREAFVALGFTEITGSLAQSSFWNFDALFTPQDHPAREIQDTFFLEGIQSSNFATPGQIKNVSGAHKKNWGPWSLDEARRTVLRTHTTCTTIKYLAEERPDEARAFSLGRVFRNEKVSYKHLVEFHQAEGVVTGPDVTLRGLMGIQEEFYKRIGLGKTKFWPTFFPYTEPSLQTMVYNERMGKWVELFGMGIFRPEVTRPLGIRRPVLAWGGGIERIAMIKYGIDDVREFYNNDLDWLRTAEKCR